MMSNSSKDFHHNRRKLLREQISYWRFNLESGALRFIERMLLGFNVSDVLGGNLGQIQHLEDVRHQIITRKLVNPVLTPNSAPSQTDTDREATTPQYLLHLQNVKIDVLTGLAYLDAGFVIDGTLAKWQKVVFRGGIGSAIKRARNAKIRHKGIYMVLPHTPFFYHAVLDELPNLLRIRNEVPACNTVIVHKSSEKWAIDLLATQGFQVEIIDSDSLIVENFFAITAPRALNKKNLDLIREGLNPEPKKILIVSRSGTPRSDDDLESAIQNALNGAEITDPGQLSISEQISLFSTAKMIIGLHGGALTNSVWMHETGKLVELFNHAYRTSDYETLCSELGQQYFAIETLGQTQDSIIEQVKGLVNG